MVIAADDTFTRSNDLDAKIVTLHEVRGIEGGRWMGN